MISSHDLYELADNLSADNISRSASLLRRLVEEARGNVEGAVLVALDELTAAAAQTAAGGDPRGALYRAAEDVGAAACGCA